MRRRKARNNRKGNILVLTAFILVGLMAMLAFAIDVGLIMVTRQQLQRSADSAALAGAWELIDENAPTGLADPGTVELNARNRASQFAGLNDVLRSSPQLDTSDVDVGYLANPSDPLSSFTVGTGVPANAVRVKVRRSTEINGSVPLFFARVLGIDSATTQAEATAALLMNVRGFRTPPRGQPVGMLPFALDEETCQQMLNGQGEDHWSWEAADEEVSRVEMGLSR